MPNRKLEIVQRLLADIPDPFRETAEQAMITWWANIRSEGGLRLTHHGYCIMHEILKLESWELDLTDGPPGGHRARVDKKTILALDRKLKWPYYLEFDARKKRRRIIFFGSREAMMATMYGDLEKWLASLG